MKYKDVARTRGADADDAAACIVVCVKGGFAVLLDIMLVLLASIIFVVYLQ